MELPGPVGQPTTLCESLLIPALRRRADIFFRNDKLDRAEQNRRAQQVYRRKREERMKQLEAAAAALEPTRKALADTQGKLRALAQVSSALLAMPCLWADQRSHTRPAG